MGLIKITGGGVIESIGGVCNGQTIKTSNGDITLENVTAEQGSSTTYTDQKGSSITYTPPTGTKTVLYESYFHIQSVDAHGISHHRLYIDSTEVEAARVTFGGEDKQGRYEFKFPITVGAAADDIANGKLQTWTTAKTIKIQFREYSSSNEQDLHSTNHWDGSGTDIFSVPLLYITALS
jgi:hypothetical protein